MPFHCPLTVHRSTADQFSEIDRLVMRCAYASQNQLGRLCEERVYENDVALRLRSLGISDIYTQVPVTASVGDFSKRYRLDLVANGMVYEFKTVSQLSDTHDAQVLHYAMMLGVNRIKLLNFRGPKVEGRLRFNAIPPASRYDIQIEDSRFLSVDGPCDAFRQKVVELVHDLGLFLRPELYEQALIHSCGGEFRCCRRTKVRSVENDLGHHNVLCYAPSHMFCVTSLTRDTKQYESHLRRLVQSLEFQTCQWVNLNHGRLEFVSITK